MKRKTLFLTIFLFTYLTYSVESYFKEVALERLELNIYTMLLITQTLRMNIKFRYIITILPFKKNKNLPNYRFFFVFLFANTLLLAKEVN